MRAETKVVLRMERFARELLRWARDEVHIFGEHNMQAERVRLCEEFGADYEVVCQMEEMLIDRRMEKQYARAFQT